MIKALEGKINKTDELVKNNVNVETTNNKNGAVANDDDEEQANSDDNDVTSSAVSTTVKNRCIVCYRLLKNWKGNRLAKYSDISVDLGANDLNVSTTTPASTTLVNRKKLPTSAGGQDSHKVFNLIKKYLISNNQLTTNVNGSRLLNSLFVDVNNNNTTGTNGNKKSTLKSLAGINNNNNNNNKNKNDQIKKSVPCSFKLCQSCHECINQIDDHMRNFQKLRRLMRTRLDKSFRLIKLKRLKQQQQQKAQVNVTTTTNGPLVNGQNGRVRQHRSLLLVNGSKNSGLNKLMKTFHTTANKTTTKTTTLNVQLSSENDSFYLPTTADKHKTPLNQSTSSLRRDCIYMIDDIHDDSVKIENNNNLNTASNSNEAGCCVDQNSNSPNAENQSSNRRKRKSRNPSRLSNKDEYNGQSTYSEIQYCHELKENTSTSSTNAKLNKKSDLNAHPSSVDADTIDLVDKIKSNAKTNHNNNHINNTISNNNKNLTRNANRYDHANSNSKQLVHVGTTTGALHNVNSSLSSSQLAQKSLESRILNSANKNSSASSSSSSSNPLARLNLEQQFSIKILDPHAASTAIESTKPINGPNTKTIKLFKNKENADNKLTSSNQPAQQQHLLLLLPPPPPLSHSNELQHQLQLQLQSPSSKRPVLNRPTRHLVVNNANTKSKLKANDFNNNNKENDLIDQNNNNLNGAGDEINDENDEVNDAEHELNNNNSLDDDEELIHGDEEYMDDVVVNSHKLHIGNDNDDEDVDYDGEVDDPYQEYENIHNTVEDVIEDETVNGNVDDDDDDVESQVMNGANGYQLDDDDNDNDEEEDEPDEDENENELDNDDDEDEDDDDENDNDNDDDDDEDEDYNEPGHIASLLSSSKARKSPATLYHNLTSILSGTRNRTATGNRKSGANVNSRNVKGDRSLAAAIKYENASASLAAGHTASLYGLSQLNNHHNHHNNHHHNHNQGNQRNDTSKHCCNICKKSFKTQNILRQHMRIHTGDKPFVCEICNKAFSQMASLKYHLATHSDDRPFKCEDCSKTFKLKPPFKKHIKECPQRLQKLQEQKLTTAHAASGNSSSSKQKQTSPPSSASNLSNNSSSVSPLYFNQHK